MFNKSNIKWLAGIFSLLLLLTLIVALRNNSNTASSRNRSFNSELVSFDSSKVTSIAIYPKFGKSPIELLKKEGEWKVTSEGKEYNAEIKAIEGVLSIMNSLRAKRIAANQKAQWGKYELTDSLATRVIVKAGKKEVVNLLAGKFSYQQPKNQNPYMAQQQQQQGTMTSYIRMEDDNKVYAVDGMLALSFNRQVNDFRNRKLIDSGNESWDRISIESPGESLLLIRQGNNWMIDGRVADSASTAKYLSGLAHLGSTNFIDESLAKSDTPEYKLKIEGKNITIPIQIQAFPSDTTHRYALSSSLNKGTFFSGKDAGLFEKVFKPKSFFIPAKEEEMQ